MGMDYKKEKSPETQNQTKNREKKFTVVFFVLGFLLLLTLSALGYLFYLYKELQNPAPLKTEIQEITEVIGSVYELPQDETPNMATVTDKSKLDNQPFFQKAENGDKILIYPNLGKAFLYRPSSRKVIDITTVSQSETPAPASNGSSLTEESIPVLSEAPKTVTLLNGGTKDGATSEAEAKILQNPDFFSVTSKEVALKRDYQGIIVVDVGGKLPAEAQKLAELLGGKVSLEIPEGENPAGADLTVIIGN